MNDLKRELKNELYLALSGVSRNMSMTQSELEAKLLNPRQARENLEGKRYLVPVRLSPRPSRSIDFGDVSQATLFASDHVTRNE